MDLTDQQAENLPVPKRRFVILFHQFSSDHPRDDHWDLMLETESGLQTWALDQMPNRGITTVAVPLAEHRKSYLDYEGPVSGNRGSVTRTMSGTYFWSRTSKHRLAVLQSDGDELRLEFCGDNERLFIVVT